MRSSSGEYAGGMVSADLFFFSCVLQTYLSKSCSMVTNRTHNIWQIAGFSRGDEGIVSINVGRRRRWNVPDEGDGFANEIDRNVESDRGLREAIRREPALFSKQRTTMMLIYTNDVPESQTKLRLLESHGRLWPENSGSREREHEESVR